MYLRGRRSDVLRFLAKSAEKSLPFFKTLKKCTKKNDFYWTEEAEAAFKQMKQLIAELPTLTAPEEKEEIIVYLAAAKEAVIERSEEDDPDTAMDVEEELSEPYILFTDGSSYADGSGAGLILTNPEGAEFTYALRFSFEATNNEAEYEALIAGLRIAEEIGVKNLQENVDSRTNSTTMVSGWSLSNNFLEGNKKADAISKITSTSFTHLSKQVLVKELKEKSINEVEVLAVVEEEGNTWMTLIYEYLTEETLPAEVNKARAVRCKSQRFVVINGVLYKKSFLGPWLRFANRILLAYYAQGCKGTDKGMPRLSGSSTYPKKSVAKADPITSPWPFYKWGIDIAGPFPEGPGRVKFLIVAIDYFTKWIEAKQFCQP
ncbi:reverse transcriptase domain-containing protein [Tanacetum coccineum]